MALRWKAFAPNTILKAVEVQDLADNGVIQLDTAADLASADLVNANVVYVTGENQPYVRLAAGVGADKWKVFSGGLAGLGGWTDVTATTGSPTIHDYTDADGNEWRAYEFTGDGDITTTEGLVEALIVGGGAGGLNDRVGGGGAALEVLTAITAGSHTVTVGAGGNGTDTDAANGQPSTFNGQHAGNGWAFAGVSGQGNQGMGGGGGTSSNGGGQVAGGGARGPAQLGTPGPGLMSSIKDGTPIEYGKGAALASGPVPSNTGSGGGTAGGASGVVIVRVPKANGKA